MNAIIEWIDGLNERVGRAISWLTALLVGVVFVDVLARYLFKTTAPWVMELEWQLFALVFLLGAGYTLKENAHVRVDVFYDRFDPRDKAWVNIVGSLFLLLPWTVLIIIYATDFAWSSWLIGEGSSNPGGLPAFYLIKTAIPLGFFLLFLQGLAEILRSWKDLKARV